MSEVKCKICGGKHSAMGYCPKHYMQFKRHGKIYSRTRYDKNEIIDHGIYCEIILYKNKGESVEVARAKIDTEDKEKVQKYKWRLSRNRVTTSIGNGGLFLHQLIMEKLDSRFVIRHINDDGLDNRKQNLIITDKFFNPKIVTSQNDKTAKEIRARQTKKISAENHYNWKGYYIQAGYILIYMPDHPFPNHQNKYIFEHRYMAECILGRFLLPTERIHHIDGNKINNLSENLFLFNSSREHQSYHHAAKNNKSTLITKSNLYNFQYVK